MKRHYSERSAAALLGILFMMMAGIAFSGSAGAAGIVESIEKAPIIADGDVTGMPTDIVITLNGSMDHNVPGRGLAVGNQIKVIFPSEFDLANLDSGYPVSNIRPPSSPPPPCRGGNLQCTTGVLSHGWPQQPVRPPFQFYNVSIDPIENAFVFTAVQDIEPTPPDKPGIKKIHLMLHGVINPQPGEYYIRVEAQTGECDSWETGSGILKILPYARPSVNVTSVFVKALSGQLPPYLPACGPAPPPPNNDNPVYQTTTVGSPAPFVWTFLIWGKNMNPVDDVYLDWSNANHAILRSGNKAIGHVFIETPHGAAGFDIEMNPYGLSCPTLLPAAPIIGATPGIGPQPVGRFDLLFHAGDLAGNYITTITLNNGNDVQMVVTAE